MISWTSFPFIFTVGSGFWRFNNVIMSSCTGWQPGMQENAAEWDDDWDKFQDEGLLCSRKHVLITSFGWWMYLSFMNKCLFFINKGSDISHHVFTSISPRFHHVFLLSSWVKSFLAGFTYVQEFMEEGSAGGEDATSALAFLPEGCLPLPMLTWH